MPVIKKHKIALVGYRHNFGGAERVLSNLSFVFDKLGYEVHVIIMIDDVSYPYAGTLFNVGALRSSSNSFLNKINRFWALRKYIRKQKFDAIIDFRFRVNDFQELMIYKFAYKANVLIQTVRSGYFKNYLFRSRWLSRFVFKNFDKIVCISERQMKAVQDTYDFDNLTLIYNPIDIQKMKNQKNDSSLNYEYILAVGRFDKVKQFDKLIETYSKSVLPESDIHLVLLGDGPELDKIQNKIKEVNLSDKIHLEGFLPNPYGYMKNALFLVNSSYVEGLPMVLLESLACETPVIAFDCFTGPSEIIMNNKNGILVENQNFEQLKYAMNELYLNKNLYNECKAFTLKSIQKFDSLVIEKQWEDLLQELLTKKPR